MIWPLPLTNLQCPCLELISNELSGWIFCCVRRTISNPFPTALKTRDAFQVWPVHVTGCIPHSPYSFTLEIPAALPALKNGNKKWITPCIMLLYGAQRQMPHTEHREKKTKPHRRLLKRISEKDKTLFPDLLLTLLNKLWHYCSPYCLGCANRAMG